VIWKSARETRFFRSISALLVIALCGLFVFPIPIIEVGSVFGDRAGSGKDTSVPFPCMLKSCGCRNAEDCWRGCCCFTNTQKLAWATKNNVDVPAYVVDAAHKEQQSPESSSSHGVWLSLLATFFAPATSAHGADCCSKSSDSSSPEAACCTAPSAGSQDVSVRLVSTVKALQCRGLSLTLALASTMLVSSAPRVEIGREFPDVVVAITSETLPDATLRPPVPPPRLRDV
jgi:hypothetical protein